MTRRLVIIIALAVLLAALGIGVLAITTLKSSGRTETAGSTSSTRQTTVTATETLISTSTLQNSATAPAPWGYSMLTREPYLRVTPTNHTFTIPFDVTTRNYSISLTYDPVGSYAWLFSKGTQWASSGRPCEASTSVTATGGPSTTTSATTLTTVVTTTTTGPPILTHISQVPCGEFPGEWWALNGTLISEHVAILPNDVQVTIQPSSIPAHYAGRMNVTLNIRMPPGNYGVFLAVRLQEPDNTNFGTALQYILYYMPVVVERT